MRQRERLLEYAASHIQHMQKALTEMNVQLHHVVADITGATTGLRIIRAILAGERAPEVLAAKPFYLLAGAGAVQQDLRRQNAIVTERAGPAAAPPARSIAAPTKRFDPVARPARAPSIGPQRNLLKRKISGSRRSSSAASDAAAPHPRRDKEQHRAGPKCRSESMT